MFEFVGPGLHINPVQTASCLRYPIGAETPLVSGIEKSGAFDREDPNYQFYDRWFNDPELHLPPGQWRVVASAEFHGGTECEGSRRLLSAPITITVVE